MVPDRARTVAILQAIIHEIRTERVTFMAGSIAYNAFLSLLPLLFLLLALVTSVGSDSLETTLVTTTRAIITAGAGDLLVEELRASSVSISLLGAAVLAWGALRIFRSLDMAFSDIYESKVQNTVTDQLTDGLIVLVTIVLVVLLVLVVESRIDVPAGLTLGWGLQRTVLFGGLILALFPMFYLFSDEPAMRWIEAVPGTLFAAFGLLILQSLFGIYLEFSSPQVQNSMLASIIIFLTWLYFNALIILLGGAINAVLTNRSAQVDIDPVIGDRSTPGQSRARNRSFHPATLSELSDELSVTESFEMIIDGESRDLPPPERVEVDLRSSHLPFIYDSASLMLQWQPED